MLVLYLWNIHILQAKQLAKCSLHYNLIKEKGSSVFMLNVNRNMFSLDFGEMTVETNLRPDNKFHFLCFRIISNWRWHNQMRCSNIDTKNLQPDNITSDKWPPQKMTMEKPKSENAIKLCKPMSSQKRMPYSKQLFIFCEKNSFKNFYILSGRLCEITSRPELNKRKDNFIDCTYQTHQYNRDRRLPTLKLQLPASIPLTIIFLIWFNIKVQWEKYWEIDILRKEPVMWYTDIQNEGPRKITAISLAIPPSLTAVTVSPALVLPNPVVITDLLLNLAANFKNWDFPVPSRIKYVRRLLKSRCLTLSEDHPSKILAWIKSAMGSRSSKRTK